MPVGVAYVGWALVGFGMGVAFPTIPLAAMRGSAAGAEGTDVSSVLLLDMLGVATGAGLGGGVVAVTLAWASSSRPRSAARSRRHRHHARAARRRRPHLGAPGGPYTERELTRMVSLVAPS